MCPEIGEIKSALLAVIAVVVLNKLVVSPVCKPERRDNREN